MGFGYQTGGDTSTGSKFLTEPGTYHALVTRIDEQPTNKKGELIDNAAFRVELSVLDGTVEGQKDKVTDFICFHPKPSDKNDGAFARKKFDMFFLATGLLTKEQIEKREQVNIELQNAVGKQLVAKFAQTEDGKYLELSFADIFHVDDSAVASIPKDKESLAMLPASERWINNREKTAPAAEKREPAKAAAASTPDYGDL